MLSCEKIIALKTLRCLLIISAIIPSFADINPAHAANQLDPKRQMQESYWKGDSYLKEGKFVEAIDEFQRARGIARNMGDGKSELSILEAMVKAYDKQGRLKEQLKIRQEQLEINRGLALSVREKESGEMFLLADIGELYARLIQPGEALKHYQQALALSKKLGNVVGFERLMNSLEPGIIAMRIAIVIKKFLSLKETAKHREAFNEIRRLVEDGSIGIFVSPLGPLALK